MRIGHGFDVHRLVPGRKLILGGVDISFEKGLAGHSDADVLTHAVMDAVLGALGADDIGTHFPDTDPAYKDISSLVLLKKVVELMRKSKYQLGNLDVLLHADKPKVKEYIPAMRLNLAKAFDCDQKYINVKATTWEGLGFAGTGQGMAASAVCLLYRVKPGERDKMSISDTQDLFGNISPQKIKVTKGKAVKGKAFVVNIDGASRGNPGPASIGVIVRDPERIILAEISEAIGEATNNVAEYKALIRALEECRLLKAKEAVIGTDSLLLERQINGAYKVKDPYLRQLFEKVVELASYFDALEVRYIPRDKNWEADKLANSALK